MAIHPCALKANEGDQLEFSIDGIVERHVVVGRFRVEGYRGNHALIITNTKSKLPLYYLGDVLDDYAEGLDPDAYCVPIMQDYLPYNTRITKVYKKSWLKAREEKKNIGFGQYVFEYHA